MADTTNLPASVSLTSGAGDLPCVRVSTPLCVGTVYLSGATVTEWTPVAHDPVLFLSACSHFVAGQPIRGGVPVCAPWFGKGRGNDKPVQHGFFRTARWEVVDARDAEGVVTLTFALDVGAAAEAAGLAALGVPTTWHGTTATYVVSFGDELDLALTVRAGEEDLDLEEALHTYFSVGDVRQVTVAGLQESRYVDKAPGGRAVNAQTGDVSFARQTDRIYAHEGTATIKDPVAGRTITVAKEGSGSTVIWNPWQDKAAAMDDLADDDWPLMLCVESANAARGSLTVAAGASHTLRQHVSVAKI